MSAWRGVDKDCKKEQAYMAQMPGSLEPPRVWVSESISWLIACNGTGSDLADEAGTYHESLQKHRPRIVSCAQWHIPRY